MVHPGPQQAVQAFAIVGSLDLLGIGGGYGGHLVGKHDAALHAGAHAEELQRLAGVGPRAQVQQILHHVDGEEALILEVVNGVDGADVLVVLEVLVLSLQQDRDQARLPVVAVDHVGDEVDLRQRFQHGPAEVGEALALVTAHAVDIIASEILLVIHEIEGDAGIDQLHDAHVLAAPAEIDIEIEHVLHLIAPALVNGLVQGQDDANILAGLEDLFGKRAYHIRQTTGFDERNAFRRGK